MPNQYYYGPQEDGRQQIAQALLHGFSQAQSNFARGQAEGEEKRRYEADKARQEKLDQAAEADRLRRQQIENAELGVIDPAAAYEQASGVTAPRPAPPPAAAPDEAGVRVGVTPGPGRQIGIRQHHTDASGQQQLAPGARLREGVTRSGGMLIDPRQSLAYKRQQIAQQEAQAAAAAERNRVAEEAYRAAFALTGDEAASRAYAAEQANDLDPYKYEDRTQAAQQATRRREHNYRLEEIEAGKEDRNSWSMGWGSPDAARVVDLVKDYTRGFYNTHGSDASPEALRTALMEHFKNVPWPILQQGMVTGHAAAVDAWHDTPMGRMGQPAPYAPLRFEQDGLWIGVQGDRGYSRGSVSQGYSNNGFARAATGDIDLNAPRPSERAAPAAPAGSTTPVWDAAEQRRQRDAADTVRAREAGMTLEQWRRMQPSGDTSLRSDSHVARPQAQPAAPALPSGMTQEDLDYLLYGKKER